MRSLADLLLGFCSNSSGEGRMGFLVMIFAKGFLPHTHTGNSGGQVQTFTRLLKYSFTIRSSKEWNVMMHILPPGFKRSKKLLRPCFNDSSSPFTSMRIAWNVRFAGCFSRRLFAGMERRIISINSPVVSISFSTHCFTIFFAILKANFSSP